MIACCSSVSTSPASRMFARCHVAKCKRSLIGHRNVSTKATTKLRIGYVPEQFSTPLFFAQKHFNLNAELLPFPSGTGHMVQSLKSSEIDIGVGLTEGWVAALGKKETAGAFKIIGTYVKSPLCWAINVSETSNVNSVDDLVGKVIGISRFGSGSHIMSYVLADQKGWLSPSGGNPFVPYPLDTFELLRRGVNKGFIDFFLWEHFTCKRYHETGEIFRIGEISSPWSSWKIVARDPSDQRLGNALNSIDQGIAYFNQHHDEAVQHISSALPYSKVDAQAWLKTVEFAEDVRKVDHNTISKTIATLRKANVLNNEPVPRSMIATVQ